jgi:hypothetical protein
LKENYLTWSEKGRSIGIGLFKKNNILKNKNVALGESDLSENVWRHRKTEMNVID